MSAIITYKNQNEEKFKSCELQSYQKINKLHFILPELFNIFGCTNANPCVVTVILAGFKNAAYAFPSNYDLKLRVISQKKTYLK